MSQLAANATNHNAAALPTKAFKMMETAESGGYQSATQTAGVQAL